MLLGPEGGTDLVPYGGLLALYGLDRTAQHGLGFTHDLLEGLVAAAYLEHIAFEHGGHLRLGDTATVLLQGAGKGDPSCGGDHLSPLYVIPGVELAYDVVPGALRAQVEPVHLLYQGPLVVPVRRLRSILLQAYGPDIHRVPDIQLVDMGIGFAEILAVVPFPALLLQDVPFCLECLAANVDGALRDLGFGVGRQCRQESPDYQFVELPFVTLHRGRPGSGCGMDRRMVRRSPLPSGRGDLLPGKYLRRLLGEIGILQPLQYAPEAEADGILCVLCPGV
ncbi:hypothetical protein SDC9_149532 [bioreactor metagenome]|uniref:Uncharacterized protein n=1 Tax=bioreactor metagenome TaxID=1076179 RepID=A0A645ELH6_9ZZZZ